MIEKGYQHRGISIGNVLSIKDGPCTWPVEEVPGDCRSPRPYHNRLVLQVETCLTSTKCHGLVIGWDKAIKLKPYLGNKQRRCFRMVNWFSFLTNAMMGLNG